MSWQLSILALLAVIVVGGLAWYERSRPTSRMVALVAALAALAVAGRLVLAPVPNVVATTDIALLTGYALGGAPGFAVGALAAPVSNFWLGQGPWTPWQMAGWGLVGLAGAGLAAASGRRLGRFGLAAACGLAGLAYGALLDLHVLVTYGGEQSLDRYLALSARAIPFNVAHALGNVAFALAAGPALVRMISRYRARFEFSWGRRARPARASAAGAARGGLALLAALTAIAATQLIAELPAAATEPAPVAKSGGEARRWLERAQNADGGFGASPGTASSAAMSGWAMLGLEASGRNPLDMRRHGHSPVDFLRSRAASMRGTGDLERTILAIEGAGIDSRAFGGADLVAALRAQRDGNGSFSSQVNLTSFGILALRAGGVSGRELGRSAAWLRRAQNGDGGWGFRRDAPSDADSTGAALQGLAAAAGHGSASVAGLDFLRRIQNGDGGFSLSGSGSSNSQSTAWAVQGVVAAGADPRRVRSGGHSPLDYLAARQQGDGHYRYSASSDQTPVWVTGQALVAVNRQAFPLQPAPRTSQPGGLPPPVGSDRAGGGDGDGAPASAGAGARGSAKHGAGKRRRHEDRGSAQAARAREQRADRAAEPGRRVGEVAAAQATSAPAARDEEDDTGRLVAGLGLLAAALAGGYVWRRRRAA